MARIQRRPPGRGVEWEFETLVLPQDFSRNVVTRDARRARRARRLGARPAPHRQRRQAARGAAPQDHPAAADPLRRLTRSTRMGCGPHGRRRPTVLDSKERGHPGPG